MPENKVSGAGQMPESMRAVFETGVAQARAMVDQMMSATERAMSGFEGSAKAFQSSALDANRKIMTIAEQNVTAALGLAERLVRARDVQEILQAHQAYAREQMERLSEQTRELTELARSATGRVAEGGGSSETDKGPQAPGAGAKGRAGKDAR